MSHTVPRVDPLAGTIVEWTRFFLRHWLAFTIVFVVAAGLGALYALRLPNRYTATAGILPYVPPPAVAGLSELIGGTAMETKPFEMATLYSQVALSRVILADLAGSPYRGETLGILLARGEGEPSMSEREMIETLRGLFQIHVNPRTYFVSLSATHRDPEFAAAAVAGLIELMNDYVQRRTDKGMTYAREMLETHLGQVADRMVQAREELVAFDGRHGPAAGTELYSQREALRAHLLVTERMHKEIEDQLELVRIAERHYSSVVQVLDAPEAPLRKSGPPRAKIVALCALISLLAALIYLRARDAVQAYLATEAEARR